MANRIEMAPRRKLVGKRLTMSFSNDKTVLLWKSFMPERKKIGHTVSCDLFCVQVYGQFHDFENFNPQVEFEKWAAVEVALVDTLPEGMEMFTIPGGLYAVFIHRGAAQTGVKTFQYIFKTWLPGADYVIDHRPHFEVLGEKYKNNDPDAEEEIWIPVKKKNE